MLHFHSASVRMANPQRAMLECLEAALGDAYPSCDLLIINASIGHDLAALSAQARATCPAVRVVGASCAGVVGREGVSESMNDVAVMAVQRPGLRAQPRRRPVRGQRLRKGPGVGRRTACAARPRSTWCT
jgi:hypothetical protein